MKVVLCRYFIIIVKIVFNVRLIVENLLMFLFMLFVIYFDIYCFVYCYFNKDIKLS